jgi:hypothetical protein
MLKHNNLDVKIEGHLMHITIDLDKPVGRTKAGTKVMIATTHGSVQLPAAGGTVGLAVNLTR